jgi:uncharacterized glyoxalase superfamily protein PhnB
MGVDPVPEGYHTVTPYLVVEDAARFVEFLHHAFDATELDRSVRKDGTVMHAAVRIGDSNIMIGGANEEHDAFPGMLYLYVPNVDRVYTQALEAGADSLMKPTDQFYGDRNAGVQDRWGNQWWIGTHIEDVSADELSRRERERK